MAEVFARGARVTYHDPLMPQIMVGGDSFDSVDLDPVVLRTLDAVVLLTPHTSIDYDRIIGAARLVVDTHSGLQPREAPNVVNVWVPEAATVAAPVLS